MKVLIAAASFGIWMCAASGHPGKAEHSPASPVSRELKIARLGAIRVSGEGAQRPKVVAPGPAEGKAVADASEASALSLVARLLTLMVLFAMMALALPTSARRSLSKTCPALAGQPAASGPALDEK